MSPWKTFMLNRNLENIRQQLLEIEEALIRTADTWQETLKEVHFENRISATNLIHYLALRSLDIRELQEQLHEEGLSALTNSESHILYQIQAILSWLEDRKQPEDWFPCNNNTGRLTLQRNALQLLGNKETDRVPYIMITFDKSFADDVAFIKLLLKEGMNVARINCAHDEEADWLQMISSIKHAMLETGLYCKIYMDLAGPKLRTALPGDEHKKGRWILKKGMRLKLAERDFFCESKGKQGKNQVIICSVSGIVEQLKVGQNVLFDDGTIAMQVVGKQGKTAELEVERISKKKPHLKTGKGINFPGAVLEIESLTAADLKALPFVAQYADLVGYSFVRTTEDLRVLQNALDTLAPSPPPIILKIETPEAFTNLPALLLQAMTRQSCGVMIARGDLAVEAGLERLSEIQEEILWICEAAHVPVVWATQVLESLNKKGMATRSEGTDAARAAMAECVMVNKGNHTLEVMKVLKNILHRSTGHRFKRRHLFRPLSIAQKFLGESKALQSVH